ncbi:MAG: chemotaxis response regulator protein-glutamate methylesterase [Hyphomicrobiaceae bacterium]
MTRIRVLVVDDSAAMRGLIVASLSRDPAIDVVGEAADPIAARQAIKALNPDVVTLDVEMPNMCGLEFLEKIMRLRPMPVIMVSSLTARGAEASVRALAIGAVDCVPKPSEADPGSFDDLPAKVMMAARARVHSLTRPSHVEQRPAANPTGLPNFEPDGRVVAIGASTGGVEALIEVLSKFPANCPPTLVVQHMPALFTPSFAQRLNRLCAPTVAEATDGTPLAAGHVYLAPGGVTHLEVTGTKVLRCRLHDGDPVSGHRPSVDVLFASVAKSAGSMAVGVILTGMGRDGANGLLAMRKAGARTLGQNEESCVVYGMPKAAFENGAAEKQVPLDEMATQILINRPLEHQQRKVYNAIR